MEFNMFEKNAENSWKFDVQDRIDNYTTNKVIQEGWVFIKSEDRIKIGAIFVEKIDFGDPLNR